MPRKKSPISDANPDIVETEVEPVQVAPAPSLVKVRTLHGIWNDNPNKGGHGEPDTVKTPRGTEMEIPMEEALALIEAGLAERVK